MPSSALSSAEFFPNQRVNRPNDLPVPKMPDRRLKLRLLKKARRCHHVISVTTCDFFTKNRKQWIGARGELNVNLDVHLFV